MAGRLEDADISDADRQLLDFCRLVSLEAQKTTPELVQELRDVGWTDQQIAEAVQVASMFAMFNRVADAFGLPDPGYFDRGESTTQVKPASKFE